MAANQSHAKAQFNLGLMYDRGPGVPLDKVQAYMWATLSAANGIKEAIILKDGVAKKMTPAQIAEAQKLIREWKPKK